MNNIIAEKATRENLPPGAVLLSRPEALNAFYASLYKHKPTSDVYWLRYGGAIVGALSSISGLLMLRHFRVGLGLRKEAQISSNLAATFVPCIGSFVYHFLLVTPTIVLEEEHCPLCLELRSASIQAFSGFMLPYSLGIVSASMTAAKLGAHVPTLVNPIKLAQLSWYLATRNNGPIKFAGLFFINVLGAMFLVHAEGIQLIQFKRRVAARRLMSDD